MKTLGTELTRERSELLVVLQLQTPKGIGSALLTVRSLNWYNFGVGEIEAIIAGL